MPNDVETHHTNGSLEEVILGALAEAGKDPDRLTLDDLAMVEELRVGNVVRNLEEGRIRLLLAVSVAT